jgi:hypothetical protein
VYEHDCPGWHKSPIDGYPIPCPDYSENLTEPETATNQERRKPMPIIASLTSDSKEFKPAPPGTFIGVCVDVVDLGLQEVTFQGKTKMQPKIRVYWQIEEINPDNERPFLVTKRYTLSLHEKSALRKDLVSWRGRDFTDDELSGFDLETLIGVNAMLTITHNENDGRTYANVSGISKLHKSMTPIKPLDYVRKIDRKDGDQKAPHAGPAADVVADDDIPF